MARYEVDEVVFFIPMKQETKIIKVMPKGEAGLKQTYYVVECFPKKAFTSMALKPVIRAVKQDERRNKCVGCRFLVAIEGKKRFCFVSNQIVEASITMDLRPSECILGTEKEIALMKGKTHG